MDGEEKPQLDDLLLQEIASLREKLMIMTKILYFYEPDIILCDFMHDLGTCDLEEYKEWIKGGSN